MTTQHSNKESARRTCSERSTPRGDGLRRGTREPDLGIVSSEARSESVPLRASDAKWPWACRSVDLEAPLVVGGAPRRAGDVVVGRVRRVSNHTRIVDRDGRRSRLYEGDLVVGVLGARYATDAFYGTAEVSGGRVHMLTNAGMMGCVVDKNAVIKGPTELDVLGALLDPETNTPMNLIEARFRACPFQRPNAEVVLVLGTGMNAGKTTSATKMVRGLLARGLKVAALKITGSVSPGDRSELVDTGAHYVQDFSDYGFPSTFLVEEEVLFGLAARMLHDADESAPDVIVAELADGVLQRETSALIQHLGPVARAAVLAAPCALSAMAALERVERAGLEVCAVTGLISSSPLFGQELFETTGRSVVSSTDDGSALGAALYAFLEWTDAPRAA